MSHSKQSPIYRVRKTSVLAHRLSEIPLTTNKSLGRAGQNPKVSTLVLDKRKPNLTHFRFSGIITSHCVEVAYFREASQS